MRLHTHEVARFLGIEPSNLRLLMRQGKIKAPPMLFDPKTNSTVRMWSLGDIEQARNVLNSIEDCGRSA